MVLAKLSVFWKSQGFLKEIRIPKNKTKLLKAAQGRLARSGMNGQDLLFLETVGPRKVLFQIKTS